MGGYIGATAVGLTTTAADVQGDITSTDTTPELILKNTSEEDTEGGREGKITFKGEQSGGEESTLAQIESAHDGTSDDQKGDLIFKTNDGSDGASPTERVRIDSNGSILTATLGTDNVHLGEGAGASIASGGNNNVAIGKDAGTALTTGDNNTAIGYEALKTEDGHGNNVAVGYQSLKVQNAGANAGNTAIGYQSGVAVTDGHSNTMIGTLAGSVLTTGDENTYVGYGAGSSGTTTFTGNTALGFNSLAAGANVGDATTAIGWSTLKNTNANSNGHNTALGYNAGRSNDTGYDNTFIGSSAGNSNSTGYSNTMLGKGAGSLITTGNANTVIGRFDGNQDSLDIRTSSNNIVLSDGAGTVMAYFRSNREMLMGQGQFNGATNAASGNFLRVNDRSQFNVSGGAALAANRLSNDGSVFEIRQDGATEGSISVSGSTVSYNGGHLARWAQLTDGSKDTSIVKGTVMTNLDQMSVWPNRDIDGNVTEGNEENEQLNCMAVSSVEGDVNVAGVFVNWDDDDNLVNDMNVAMTGDMVIRIAQGTTVARGDLLMSAGDGTAKPQGDDIVRSKTIAKVTSTNVSHTYDDGSYLVPCVLMAC